MIMHRFRTLCIHRPSSPTQVAIFALRTTGVDRMENQSHIDQLAAMRYYPFYSFNVLHTRTLYPKIYSRNFYPNPSRLVPRTLANIAMSAALSCSRVGAPSSVRAFHNTRQSAGRACSLIVRAKGDVILEVKGLEAKVHRIPRS